MNFFRHVKATRKPNGFTLVELLFTITLLAILFGMVVMGFQDYARYQQYNQGVNSVAVVLNQARVNARSAVDDSAHGVKFGAGSITRFTGDTYVALDPNNVVVSYSEVIFTPELTGGTDEIVFERLTGLPSATGTVLVSGVQYPASSTITISETGIIE